jgi:cytochrome P450
MSDQLSAVAPTMASPEVMVCPFAAYDEIRESTPAYIDPVTGFYVVTRFADIRAIAADPGSFSNRTGILTRRTTSAKEEIEALYVSEGVPHINTLVSNDPPDHRRYRALVDKVFSTLRVRSAEASIQAATDEMIDAFPVGHFDFGQAFAIALPVRIIAEQLGVPPERGADFKRWSDALLEAANQGLTHEQELAAARTIIEMQKYFRDMTAATRAAPDDSLLSALANTVVDDVPLCETEVVALLQQILVAGNETTTNALASGMLRLVDDPVLQAELRADPGLIPNFCEEVLRLDSPLQGLFRRATRATEIGGVTVPEGAILDLRWGAGNRDERHFAAAEKVDLTRKNPSQHLAFGFGIHFCIGNQLARAELRIAFTRLLARSSNIRLANIADAVDRRPHFIAYGVRRLMIVFDHA